MRWTPPGITSSRVRAEMCSGALVPFLLHCLPVWLRASRSNASHQPPHFGHSEGKGTDTENCDLHSLPRGKYVIIFFKSSSLCLQPVTQGPLGNGSVASASVSPARKPLETSQPHRTAELPG